MNDNLKKIVEKQKKEEEQKNLVRQFEELKGKIKKEIKTRSWFIGEWLITIFFMILTFFIIGLPSLFKLGWDWSIYASEEFWIRYLTVQVAAWFSRVWILAVKTRRNKHLNPTWLNATESIQTFIDKDKKEPFINYNCDLTNRERKIRVFRNKQKLKILKLSIKYKVDNITNHLSSLSHITFKPFELKTSINTQKRNKKPKKRLLKRLKKVEYKMNALLKTLTIEYINANYDNLKVKYNRVSRSILTSGYSPKEEQNEQGYTYKTKSVKEFFNATLPTFLFMSAIMFLLVPLIGELSNDWNSWFTFITNVFLVFVSMGTMWLSADELFEKTNLRVLLERDDTLRAFSKKPQPQIEENKSTQ